MKQTQKLLDKIEGKSSVSDKFHAITNNKSLDSSELKEIPKTWIRIHFKTYPRLNKVKLNKDREPISKLAYVLKKRRSVRKFLHYPMSKEELSYLLFNSCGLIQVGKTMDDSRRPYPSAGARYPLEVYPIILNCSGLKKGLYHYNVKEDSLELLIEDNFTEWVIENTGKQEWLKEAAVIFIITGILDRTRIKYNDRGYRYALIESGHLGQNICLLATELGLGSCALGGYMDSKVDKLLDINMQKEYSLYLIAVGKI